MRFLGEDKNTAYQATRQGLESTIFLVIDKGLDANDLCHKINLQTRLILLKTDLIFMINTLKRIFGIGNKVNFEELISNGATIIDVRTPGEYSQGHLKRSVNIPLSNLNSHLPKLKKDKPIITCCASGMRSSSARSLLRSQGFEQVYNGGSWYSLKKYDK
jgi:phage shock protein E